MRSLLVDYTPLELGSAIHTHLKRAYFVNGKARKNNLKTVEKYFEMLGKQIEKARTELAPRTKNESAYRIRK